MIVGNGECKNLSLHETRNKILSVFMITAWSCETSS